MKVVDKILSTNSFPVVGIGASAGGLEAFQRLLKAIPVKSGMAYVLVQHLAPTHESQLAELLQQVTLIPVVKITDEIKVEPDHIYILPSNKMLVANDGVLELSPRPTKKGERNLPIDLFFTSLAELHQSNAIGVVLSGTGSDGTQGLKAIKEYGGITFAQDEASAAQTGMPQSATRAGVVDYVLPPEEIPAKVVAITNLIHGDEGTNLQPASDNEVFRQILAMLRVRRGTDFTYYKQTTIRRRILRRMAIHKNDAPADYLTFLRESKSELDNLYQDLLIPVTTFFRDNPVFDHLCDAVFPHLINKNGGEAIRIWVAGCSTGQEAYSIAICIKEFLGHKPQRVQIFASDLSVPAIAKARLGLYTRAEVDAVSPQRLQQFFTKNKDSYQVNKDVRDMCVFAPHDFLKDPPFGKLDFISCRNVLIYLEPYLQKKALTTFHYALRPDGFLLLGKTETITLAPDLFTLVVKSDKLFSRKQGPGRPIPLTSGRSKDNTIQANDNQNHTMGRTDFQKTADDIILAKYTPAGVVVDEALDIVYFRGNTSRYLEQSSGKPTHNVLLLAKYGLAFELRNLLHKARKEQTPVSKENIPLRSDTESRHISIEAIPLQTTVDAHYLVLFHETDAIGFPRSVPPEKGRTSKTGSGGKQDEKDRRINQLELELAQAREDMHSITQDQEAINEELQSANEELLSGNEELQSLNEELETGKEELQSTNEELTVVNQEMISLNEQLTAARDAEQGAKKRFQYIADSMPQKVWTADPGGNINYYNQTWLDYTGLTFEDLKDWGWKRIIHPQDWEETRKCWQHSINTGADFEQEHRLLSAQGDYKWHLSRGLAQRDAAGTINLWIGTNTEIDDQKSYQEALEAAVAQRTQELRQTNQILAEKNAELQQMNKELEAFTYMSSHDLQEPLRKIRSFAGRILEKEILSDSGQDSFQRLQLAAQRMQQLIHDLLAFSHLSTAERFVENTDLRQLADEVASELSETIAEKQAVLDTTELGSAPVIGFQFRQLLHNLIANSLKFSQPAIPPRIVLKSQTIPGSQLPTSPLSADEAYCHIVVEDNGIGFESKYSEKIFAVFQRLHGKEKYKGTGIGLAIVKKVVENHQGFITATSEPGKGARFDIYIPS